MEGDLKVKSVCRVCGCTNFFKDAGFYYCETCQTQNDEIREEIFDMRVDPSTKLRKIKIKHADRKHSEPQGWTTWEIYNFALIGLTEEMIELGASPDIKFTVLQLWSTYLSKLQVAFTSINRKSLPKLSKQFNKNDAEIIYGKIQSKKKIIKRYKMHTNSTNQSVVSATHSGYSSGTHGGSQGFHRNKKLLINSDYEKYLKSQTNSDAISAVSISAYSSNTVRSFDKEERVSFNKFAKEEKKKIQKLAKNVSYIKRVKYRKKHITSQYKTGPCVITGIKLWAIVYLAMRIHKEPIQLGDMLRFAREGHMSYYRLDHLIPSEVKLSQNDVNFLTQNTEITHKGLRKIAARMAKFIGIRKMSSPNLLPLISRYCQELALPKGVLLYAERFIALSPPTMIFDFKKSDIPNYEARAMAFIIVVLKVLFGLDGITECTISKIAERINIVGSKQDVLDTKLFSFCEWQRYIECRKNILVNKHYPTKLKYDPTLPLSNNMYLNFLEFIKSKKDGENPEINNYKHLLPRDLTDAMKRCFEKLNQDNKPSEDVTIFNPSLTPLYSYLQQLWENSSNKIPDILKTDFYETKVGYMTNINDFQQLAAQCNINLIIVNSRSHFINKIVPYFERNKMQEVSKLKEDVQICDFNESEEENIKKIENFVSYIDKNIPCYTRVDNTKLQYFDDVRNSLKMNTNFNHNDHNDFIFGDVLPDGKLLIPEENEATSDDDVLHFKDTIKQKPDTMDIDFYQKYNIQLTQYEQESILKPQELESIEDFMKRKMHRYRNSKGQFMKASEVQKLMNSYNFIKPNLIDNLNFYDLHNFTGINLDNDNLDNDNLDNNDLDSFNDLEMSLFKVPCDISKNEEKIFDRKYNFNSDLNNMNNYFDLSDISILNDDILEQNLDIDETKLILKNDIDSSEQESENMKFFCPCEDYWMYHCIFSRVKAKNFELFEKVLPRSFRWLLNECANVLEMTTEELYEEICTIENFYSQILNPNNVFDHFTRIHRSLIISKW
ncbi:PREDICTED: TATA box-binding protein-associated factor RNA polymerase I subunit B [Polistes canadensis]|uniref:TATA box-binding protein-associated factor RNA polymerase I subunit B n=1 Tax=Polistes canadensis TaxID=91411 RepID=UPI00071906CD|nr:PREDICTED: TATA box-binding protein-associated factor RNA polymerase I subunit B [Polistes canadensis]